MGAYSIRDNEIELLSLVSRVEHGEEIVIAREGNPVAKIVPITASEREKNAKAPQELRPYGLNISGLAGTDLSWLDEPLPEDVQRAFGIID